MSQVTEYHIGCILYIKAKVSPFPVSLPIHQKYCSSFIANYYFNMADSHKATFYL